MRGMTDTTTARYNITTELSPTIFRAYDIRGVVDETLTPDVIYTIGRALGSMACEQSISQLVVGRDGRLSGLAYQAALMAGITDSGCDVIDAGMVPTPLVYFAAAHSQHQSGVMLTGSHNPANHNGLKIVFKAQTVATTRLQAVYQRIQQGHFTDGAGTITEQSTLGHYLDRLVSDVYLSRRLKVVVDCGSGVTGVCARSLFSRLGCETTMLYDEVDGLFPHHHPDPTQAKNLQSLIARVKEEGADIGIAFDGDGDRLGVVTNQGEIIHADRLLMLLAQPVLRDNEQPTIVYDVKCTSHLDAYIRARDGQPIMTKTGHALIKAKMRDTGALLGGEMSGHVFFKDRWFGFDDALYAAARLLEILADADADSAELFAAIPNSINTPELSIDIADDQKFKFVERFVQSAQFKDARLITIDGLRVEFADGWGLLRPSNTTPKMVLRFEADNEAALARIKAAFKTQIHALDSTLTVP
jgi:phosphomannomutase / phosphoglucomutase